jgi:hypothetical protein
LLFYCFKVILSEKNDKNINLKKQNMKISFKKWTNPSTQETTIYLNIPFMSFGDKIAIKKDEKSVDGFSFKPFITEFSKLKSTFGYKGSYDLACDAFDFAIKELGITEPKNFDELLKLSN